MSDQNEIRERFDEYTNKHRLRVGSISALDEDNKWIILMSQDYKEKACYNCVGVEIFEERFILKNVLRIVTSSPHIHIYQSTQVYPDLEHQERLEKQVREKCEENGVKFSKNEEFQEYSFEFNDEKTKFTFRLKKDEGESTVSLHMYTWDLEHKGMKLKIIK